MKELHIIVHEYDTANDHVVELIETEDETGAGVGNFKTADYYEDDYRHIVVTKEDFE